MAGTTDVGMDVVDELRLRRWARQHHVASEERDATWHPIVLDEMRRRDSEHEMTLKPHAFSGALVPLAPHQTMTSQRQPALTKSEGTLLFRIDSAADSASPNS
ncbi:hypothetical protein [Symmachiella dynata]|uniref:hypothetical protein n=1 Tax=Symmachiella dynata TaxID=2527995 RepID=UPI00118BCFE1|nr:hypothetical protein [Symmachiella dynata]QDT50354.1 hypothetical protein Pan258_44110 [Symmachiella dynata]